MLRKKDDGSHAWKHLMDEHEEELADIETKDLHLLYEWKVERKCQTAFERTVAEAVLIQLSSEGPAQVLNIKEEWGAYEVPELSVADREKEET